MWMFQYLAVPALLCIMEQPFCSNSNKHLLEIINELSRLDPFEFNPDDPTRIRHVVAFIEAWASNPDEFVLGFPVVSKINPTRWYEGLPSPLTCWSLDNVDLGYMKAMLSEEFLEDGEWIGYCLDIETGSGDSGSYDAVGPFKFSFFTNLVGNDNGDLEDPERSEDADEIGMFSFKSHGKDGKGEYTLNGIVTREGRINVEKVRATVVETWVLDSTPWGLMGISGNESTGELGDLWLWKKEWSR
jgi:hypothetical protein